MDKIRNMKPVHKILAGALVGVIVVALVTVIVISMRSDPSGDHPSTPSPSPSTTPTPTTPTTPTPTTTTTPKGTITNQASVDASNRNVPTYFNDPTLSDDVAWSSWKQHYKRDNQEDLEKRKSAFVENRNYVKKFNQEAKSSGSTYSLKLNQFAHLTTDEINRNYIGEVEEKLSLYQYQPPPPLDKRVTTTKMGGEVEQERINWRDKGNLGQIRDQGKCRSGQIHALIAALESANMIKTGQMVPLSTQQLLDCMKNKEIESSGKSICEMGTTLDDTLAYLSQTGAYLDKDYPPYDQFGQNHECKIDKLPKNAKNVKVPPLSVVHPHDIIEALQVGGPLPVKINASLRTLHFYADGEYNDADCSPDKYNHHALLVGYDPDRQSWIVQMSFGEEWGQTGQILIKRTDTNLCGIEEGAILLNL